MIFITKPIKRGIYFVCYLLVLITFFLTKTFYSTSTDQKYLKILKRSKITSRNALLKAKKKKRNKKNVILTITSVILLSVFIIMIVWVYLNRRKTASNELPWKFPKPGINIKYRCRNPNCSSHQQSNYFFNNQYHVYKHYHKNFNLLLFCSKREECTVPGCRSIIQSKDIIAIIMHKCSYAIEGFKLIDSEEQVDKKQKEGNDPRIAKINFSNTTTSEKETKTYWEDPSVRWVSLNIEASLLD